MFEQMQRDVTIWYKSPDQKINNKSDDNLIKI